MPLKALLAAAVLALGLAGATPANAQVVLSDVRDTRYRVGGYAGYVPGAYFVNAALLGARHTYDGARHLAFAATLDPQLGSGPLFGGINRTGGAEFNGSEVSGLAEAGLRRRTGGVEWRPLAGIEWSRVSWNAFSETGLGAVGLTTASDAETSLRASAGLRLVRAGHHGWSPYAETRYLHELRSERGSLTGSFTDAVSHPFHLTASTAGSRVALASLGVMAELARGRLLVSAGYQGTFESSSRQHAFSAAFAF